MDKAYNTSAFDARSRLRQMAAAIYLRAPDRASGLPARASGYLCGCSGNSYTEAVHRVDHTKPVVRVCLRAIQGAERISRGYITDHSTPQAATYPQFSGYGVVAVPTING